MSTHIFKINFLSDKKISREIEVPSDWSLYKLAGGILKVCDFNFDHCFGFFSKITDGNCFDSAEKYELFTDLEDEGIEPTGAGSVEKTKIKQVWKKKGDKMLFMFDYGDDWRWTVECVGFGKKESNRRYPSVIKLSGKAPEQYR